MLKKARSLFVVVAAGAFAAACAGTPRPENHVSLPPNGGVYKIGNPYQIDGTWYYPREQPNYDETGIASWYGPTFYGHRTANGEMYDGKAMTAAHRTLPMPVNVRVTNLDNGRSVVVRVNDRGPYAKGRIIDLSEAAARELDVIRTGTARVRVTYLARADSAAGTPPPPETPPEIASAVPAAPTEKIDSQALNVIPGAIVAPPAPPAVLPAPVVSPSLPPAQADAQPNGQVTQVPVPPVTHIYVQIGAFSNEANARRLMDRFSSAGGLTISPIGRAGQTLYRVRGGPYDSVADADQALARLNGLGSNDAQIVVDK
ncbi:MAG TPA: septal ring lytic transglycosylase RlpA family protein [Rhizomicrobium sp.]|nr:septal ring lytic transglycosylase RlpA family protein [Rhizomicrobium sp.]